MLAFNEERWWRIYFQRVWDCFSIPALNSSSQNIGSHLIILEIHCLCHKFLTVIETSRSKRGKTTDVPIVVGQGKQVTNGFTSCGSCQHVWKTERPQHNRADECVPQWFLFKPYTLSDPCDVLKLGEKKHQIPDQPTRHFKKKLILS